MKTLKDIPLGQTAIIQRVLGSGPLRRRIMDMGLTKGTAVTVEKVAPLGDPIGLLVRGYNLSIRKADAATIVIE
jgi:ferrous iron transport protein A